jgi:hypothetical protein
VMRLRTVGRTGGTVELSFCSWERWVSGGDTVTVAVGGGFGGRVDTICHGVCVCFGENNVVGGRMKKKRESVGCVWG